MIRKEDERSLYKKQEVTGWFHTWMHGSDPHDTDILGSTLMAVVELDDGSVVYCPAYTFRFLDR